MLIQLALAVALSVPVPLVPAPAALGPQEPDGWVWTLYENPRETVLAREVPDTDRLSATLTCTPGSSHITVNLYDHPAQAGFARFSSGGASGTTELPATGTGGPFTLTLPVDHPATTNFVLSGRLEMSVGDQAHALRLPRDRLANLRRFTEICSG